MRRLTLTCLFLASLNACAQAPVAPPSAVAPERVLEQIKTEIGAASCTENAQCQALAIGHKACGGPESYLPWSNAQTSAEKLNTLAAQYSALRQDAQKAHGGMSDCRMLLAPGAVCQAGACVLQPNAKGAPVAQ